MKELNRLENIQTVVLVVGPPGIGKTSLARYVCNQTLTGPNVKNGAVSPLNRDFDMNCRIKTTICNQKVTRANIKNGAIRFFNVRLN